MKHVKLSEARERYAQLFDEVAQGEMLLISRDGESGREVWPEITADQRERSRIAMREIMEARKTAPPATIEEILAWRDEGRKY